MSHFAEIDHDDIVIRVIVAEQEFIDSGAVGHPARWIQTSYNMYGGIHTRGGSPLRKNFAAVGYMYDRSRDAFIPPRPYDNFILDEDACLWIPPMPKPDDGNDYKWDQESESWIEYTIE